MLEIPEFPYKSFDSLDKETIRENLRSTSAFNSSARIDECIEANSELLARFAKLKPDELNTLNVRSHTKSLGKVLPVVHRLLRRPGHQERHQADHRGGKQPAYVQAHHDKQKIKETLHK